jgi:hypothetical protein
MAESHSVPSGDHTYSIEIARPGDLLTPWITESGSGTVEAIAARLVDAAVLIELDPDADATASPASCYLAEVRRPDTTVLGTIHGEARLAPVSSALRRFAEDVRRGAPDNAQ